MARYLIDANLPYRFALWNDMDYRHVRDIDDTLSDEAIWHYAKENSLTIISKDADFSNYMLLNDPPPRVIHIKFGNMKMNDFHEHLTRIWQDVLEYSERYKLVNVYKERLEGIE